MNCKENPQLAKEEVKLLAAIREFHSAQEEYLKNPSAKNKLREEIAYIKQNRAHEKCNATPRYIEVPG